MLWRGIGTFMTHKLIEFANWYYKDKTTINYNIRNKLYIHSYAYINT